MIFGNDDLQCGTPDTRRTGWTCLNELKPLAYICVFMLITTSHLCTYKVPQPKRPYKTTSAGFTCRRYSRYCGFQIRFMVTYQHKHKFRLGSGRDQFGFRLALLLRLNGMFAWVWPLLTQTEQMAHWSNHPRIGSINDVFSFGCARLHNNSTVG